MVSLFIMFVLLVATFLITTQLRRKSSNLPPTIFRMLPIIGHLYLLKKPIYRTLAKISAKHGPILLFRVGFRRVLLVSSLSISQECFTKNDIVFANRPHLLVGKIFGSNYTSLGSAPYGDHWRNLRRISTVEIFSTHRLNEFHDIRADEGRLLIHKLLSESSSPVNLFPAFQELTLNVMMRMISGKRYFGVDMDEEGKRFQEMMRETFLVLGSSNLEDHLPFLSWLGIKGYEKKLIALQKKRYSFTQRLIDQLRNMKVENKNNNKKRNTMIELLLQHQETDPEYYTDQLIRNFMLNLLTTGTDTSSTTMEWCFSLLLNHTHVLEKARHEIDSRIGINRLVNESDMANLPYLRCIVKETLRMYPAGPLLVPHESSEDCVVGGYHIPRGTMLIVNQWAIHYDPNLWSVNERFHPERFEGLEGARDGFRFMPFGYGRRGCPREGLALRMLELTMGLLI